MWINSLTLTQDDSLYPNHITAVVTGIDSGSYDIYINDVKKYTRTMYNGFDLFQVDFNTYGTFTIRVERDPLNYISKSITVYAPQITKYSCSDNCTNPSTVGEYNSKISCMLGCSPANPPQPPGTPQDCIKGNEYLATTQDLILGCAAGYHRDWFGDYCKCDKAPGNKPADLMTTIFYAVIAVLMLIIFTYVLGNYAKGKGAK